MWRQRNLSLKGKVTVINSLAAALMVYPCTTLDTPENIIKETDKIFCDFLWNGKVNKIARNTVIKQIEQGGLKMTDMTSKIKSLKITWIKRAINNPTSSWKLIIDDMVGIPFEYLVRCTGVHQNLLDKLPKFYRNIMNDLNTIRNNKSDVISEILHETIWLNKNITVDQKTIFWRRWFHNGIRYIGDLLDSVGNFLSQDKLNNKYQINCTFMDHLRVRQAIPGSWRQTLEFKKINYTEYINANRPLYIYNNDNTEPPRSSAFDLLTTKSKLLYWKFVNIRVSNLPPTCLSRWEKQYTIDHRIWPLIFGAPFKVCRETRLQSFQYRTIHRILPCNVWLYIRKIVNSNDCSYKYCTNHSLDDISHYLVTCPPVGRFWESFVTWWNGLDYSKLYPLVEENIILGFPIANNEDIVLNYSLILAKYYIYCSKKYQRPINFLEFLPF